MPLAELDKLATVVAWLRRGGSRIHKRGGAQIQYSENDNCVRSTYSGMQSMSNLGGSGGMPPRKF